jgi:hypothetical protein
MRRAGAGADTESTFAIGEPRPKQAATSSYRGHKPATYIAGMRKRERRTWASRGPLAGLDGAHAQRTTPLGATEVERVQEGSDGDEPRGPHDGAAAQRARPRLDGDGRSSIAKVSHTLSVALADRLEEFAFRQRVSESAVIEFALERFFESADDADLGSLLRASGAGRRRKT